ncbi:hypothetical protein GCM10009795_005790 [Nocardioides hankookensis]|uniref:Tail assembly chaperone n=1 Tax=Nocardioides hankookensis TaxID=443157 RepID=A0ABW1LFV3_9ACTN
MSSLRTSYEFTLPRGYVDGQGRLHKTGKMRLATARDELEPLRDPTVQGPDDPRLTILVLTRVVEELGSLELVTSFDIEGLFAVDLAFLQDFYGVINFGSQEEYDALVNAQASSSLLGVGSAAAPAPTADQADPAGAAAEPAEPAASPDPGPRPNLRRAVEEIPRKAQ